MDNIADEFTSSCVMGSGQFCTNPGLVLLLADPRTDEFVAAVGDRFRRAPSGTLLSRGVQRNLEQNLSSIRSAGAQVVAQSESRGQGYSCPNTLLRVSGKQFLERPDVLQTEAFGNASLLVIASGVDEACEIIDQLDGNLTGCIYSDRGGRDEADYSRVARHLRPRVGRMLNDKMPTGVAVSSAMNHGGPYPATGHPGFTAVGIPASMLRFSVLECYDQVRPERLPACLRDKNPTGTMWRLIDGQWTKGNVG
jgi:NADP-dependent aldehyde dehydrogenase